MREKGAPAFTQALEVFVRHMNSNRSKVFLRVQEKIKKNIELLQLQKMSMTPITPTTTPAPLQNTGQIRHYEDEWVHENTITCHSACGIPYELLTEPLIQVMVARCLS